MEFKVLSKDLKSSDYEKNVAYLRIDNWNDFSFKTMFSLSLYDSEGNYHSVGDIKIGFKGQTKSIPTFEKLGERFDKLDNSFFSLGQSVEFYKKISKISQGEQILKLLRDVVSTPSIIQEITDEDVFGTSLLRYLSLSTVKGQYARVLAGGAELTDFDFKFTRPECETLGGLDLLFSVGVETLPSTNIHAVIGRNGVGKTTLLNGMIEAITTKKNSLGRFVRADMWYDGDEIGTDYFSSLISVSFSAFDPFPPPPEQPDPSKGTCYFYIGLKDQKNCKLHKTIDELQSTCSNALVRCFQDPQKTIRWMNAIEKLGSDENFSSMKLSRLREIFLNVKDTAGSDSDNQSIKREYEAAAGGFLSEMSSGHAIVLLTITELVSKVEEKTLVLLDEPESHLHPPLLSAFIRALSDLLIDRNGVAIIATHSPVVLQEVPRSCVWKIYRRGSSIESTRPNIETFAENVGVLTSEVFNLEVERSGFHDLLMQSVATGKTYKEILQDYNDSLGFEGRAILKSMIANRDRANHHDEIG